MGIGINLKIALKEHELTVAELSRKTGISTNTFYAMIRRDNQKINPDVLKKICDNTDISIYDLIDDEDKYIVAYWDPDAPKADRQIGDYLLTQIGNDDMLEDIIETYSKLNNIGKEVAHDRVQELAEIPRYTELLAGASAAKNKLKTEKELSIIEPPEDNT